MLGRSPTGCPALGDDAEVLHVVTPRTGRVRAWSQARPFALAHTFAQTGPFRPANTVRGVDNVVLAGSSTVPGVGVPDRAHVRPAGRRPDHRSRR